METAMQKDLTGLRGGWGWASSGAVVKEGCLAAWYGRRRCFYCMAFVLSVVVATEAVVGGDSKKVLHDRLVESLYVDEVDRWFPACIDEEGGYYQVYDNDWSRLDESRRGLVFQSRMIWAAATIAMYDETRSEEFVEYARHGYRFLSEVFWDDAKGGFFWEVEPTPNGQWLPASHKHVYGMSFAIYGLARLYEADNDSEDALELAIEAFRWLEAHAHDAEHGGYHEALAPNGTPRTKNEGEYTYDQLGTLLGFRSMNSHIHLLEAFTQLYRVWPDPDLEQQLEEIFYIVRDRMYVEPGVMAKYFTPQWQALPDSTSYGHNVETAFLLIEASEVLESGNHGKVERIARSMVDHALEFGWDDEHGGLYDRGPSFYAAEERQEKHWWVQAEGLNALLLMHELFGDSTDRYWEAFMHQWAFIENHQLDDEYGGWRSRVSAEGDPLEPATKGYEWKAAYHTVRAYVESLERLERLRGMQ